jgi:tetratricopeptide (TPR) repeat protein
LVAALLTAVCLAAPSAISDERTRAGADPGRQDYSYAIPGRSRLLEYLQLLQAYSQGQRDVVREKLAAWTDNRVVLELVFLPTTLDKVRRRMWQTRENGDYTAFIEDYAEGRWVLYTLSELRQAARAVGYTPDHPSIVQSLRLAAFIHADVAQYCWDVKGQYAKGREQWRLALRALQPLETIASERPFVRTWYLATTVRTFQAAAFAEAAFFLDRADKLLPDDPEIAVAHGCLHETLAMVMARKTTIPGPPDLMVKEPPENLKQAERYFREAIRLGAGAAARLRLGNVLVLQGRGAEALTELGAAQAAVAGQSRHQPAAAGPLQALLAKRAAEQARAWLYQISLVRGTAFESTGDLDAARQAYLAALKLYPAAQSPLVALSHLAFTGGDRQLPAAILGTALQVESEDYGRDPWWQYRYGNAWDFNGLLDELWDMVFK